MLKAILGRAWEEKRRAGEKASIVLENMYIYICHCLREYVCIYIQLLLYIHIYIHICTYICMYIHIYLQKAMATHSSTLAWEIPWTEEPGGPRSMGLQRVRHDWATSLHSLRTLSPEKEMANHFSILAWKVPWTEEPGGLWSMGSQRVGHDWSDWACIYIYIYHHYEQTAGRSMNIKIILVGVSGLRQKWGVCYWKLEKIWPSL